MFIIKWFIEILKTALINTTVNLYEFVTEHAKEALELSKLQETTRQHEQMAKIKEYEAAIEQTKVEQKRMDHEERRKTLQVCSINVAVTEKNKVHLTCTLHHASQCHAFKWVKIT